MAKHPDDRPRSMTEVIALLEACRTSAGEAMEAAADLKRFAETVMKRAAPRRRDQERDPSVLARPTEPMFPDFSPDLHLEDVVLDFRPEPHLRPLPEEKLPPKPPRVAEPREPAQRRLPPVRALGVLAFMVLGVAGPLLLGLIGPRPVANPKAGGPGPRVETAHREVTSGPAVVQAAKAADPPEEPKPESQLKEDEGTAVVEAAKAADPLEEPDPESQLKEDVATTVTNAEDPVATTATAPSPKNKRTMGLFKKKKPPVFTYPKRSFETDPKRVSETESSRDDPVATYRRTLEKSPENPEAHLGLGNAFQDLGRFDEAIAEYRAVVRLKPNDALDHYHLALALRDRGNFDEAIVAFREAIRLDSDRGHVGQAALDLGELLHQLRRYDEGLAIFRRILELAPSDPYPDRPVDQTRAGAHLKLGRILADQGKLDLSARRTP